MKWIFSQILSATTESLVARVSAPKMTPSWGWGAGRSRWPSPHVPFPAAPVGRAIPVPCLLGTQGLQWWSRSCVREGPGAPGGSVARLHFWKRRGEAEVSVLLGPPSHPSLLSRFPSPPGVNLGTQVVSTHVPYPTLAPRNFKDPGVLTPGSPR